MRSRSFLLIAAGVSLLLVGCESLSSRVNERFSPVPAKLKNVEANSADAFLAAGYVLRQMDFTVTRAALAQGILNAKSRILPADSLGGARQFTIELRFTGAAGGPTEVAMLLKQGVEGDFRAGPQLETLRDHGLYAAFFAALDTALKTKPPPWAVPAGGN